MSTFTLPIEDLSKAELQSELANLIKTVDVINHLAVSLDIDCAMDAIRKACLELLDCDRVTLYLIFEKQKEIRARITDDCCVRIKFGEGISGTTALTGESMNVSDVYSHPLFNPTIDKLTGYRTKNLLCCPIRDLSGKHVAVLQAVNKRRDQHFSQSDERSLALFGTHLGNMLFKAKLHEQARREKHRLSALFNYFKLISSAGNLGDLLDIVTEALREVLHAEDAFVFIVDSPRKEMWMQCEVPGEEDLMTVRVKLGEGLVGQCGLKNSKAVNLTSYSAGDDALITNVLDKALRQGRATRSVLIQPVVTTDPSGKVVAVILALNKNDNGGSKADLFAEEHFTEADTDALALFALEVSDALAARSLECAYASALSVVAQSRDVEQEADLDAMNEAGGPEGFSGKVNRKSLSEESSARLRSQLMSMYFKGPQNSPSLLLKTSSGISRAASLRHPAVQRASTVREGATHSPLGFQRRRCTEDSGMVQMRSSMDEVLPGSPFFHSPWDQQLSSCRKAQSNSMNCEEPIDMRRESFLSLRESSAERLVMIDRRYSGSTGLQHMSRKSLMRALELDVEGSHFGSDEAEEEALIADELSSIGIAWDGDLQLLRHSPAGRKSGDGRRASPRNSPLPIDVSSIEGEVIGSKMAEERGADETEVRPTREPRKLLHLRVHVDGALSRGLVGQPPGKLSHAGSKVSFKDQEAVGPEARAASSSATSTAPSAEPSLPMDPSQKRTRRASILSGQGAGMVSFFPREVLSSWSYNFTNASVDEMNKICYDLFVLSGLVDHFGLDKQILSNFLSAVSALYRNIPYHNYNHVVHVLHTTWMVIQLPSVQLILNKVDQLGLLLAALCHDLDHDGHSNSFHVLTQSDLARLYNDSSVMENHHCALTFEVLRRKDCALLDDLGKETCQRLRKIIISAILCTDMSNHFSMTQDFRKRDTSFDPECEEDRLLLVNAILHAADIGNGIRPFEINDAMSKRVHREFQVLAEEEGRLGIPVTFAIDSNNPLVCAQMEVNFLDYVVKPLWEQLAHLIPDLTPQLDMISCNREEYVRLAAAAAAEESEAAAAAAAAQAGGHDVGRSDGGS